MEIETLPSTDNGRGDHVMNNSINYCGFVDLLKKPALEMARHAESIVEKGQEPVMQQRVKSIPITECYPDGNNQRER